MIEAALIIALMVFFIHVTTWPGMIFEEVGDGIKENVPEWLSKPLIECPICMSPWWGTLILFVWWQAGMYHPANLVEYVSVVFAAAGLNVFSVIAAKFYQTLKEMDDQEEDIVSVDEQIAYHERELKFLKGLKK